AVIGDVMLFHRKRFESFFDADRLSFLWESCRTGGSCMDGTLFKMCQKDLSIAGIPKEDVIYVRLSSDTDDLMKEYKQVTIDPASITVEKIRQNIKELILS
ncbi:MAG: hypothetical protein ACI4CS_10965, partial [Candidatus Weimeria sp.]